jgi:hypothetical protein
VYIFADLPAPNCSVLGTNGAAIANGDPADAGKGTDFGSLPWGLAVSNMLAITNAGGTPLVISGLTTNGTGAAAFSVQLSAISLPAGGRTNFTVIFAPGAAGSFTAAVSIANNSTSTPYIVNLAGTGAKQDQSALSFTPTSPQAYNTTNALGTSGGSGTGAVSYAVTDGPGEITGVTGLHVTSGTGIVTVVATKAADANYHAISATGIVAAARADQAIAFPPIPDQAVTNQVDLAASASSGLPVGFAVISGPAALSYQNTLTLTGTGRVVVAASQSGNSNWNAAPSVTNSFNVTGGGQTTLPAPQNLAASAGRYADKVALVWSAVSAATGYGIWRHTAVDSAAATQIGSTSQTNYTDTSASGGRIYYYWIKATNAVAASAFSASASGWRRTAGFSHYADVDLDGDRKADLVIFDPLTGAWRAKLSGSGYAEAAGILGGPGCTLVPGDYDGDRKSDPGVYEEASGRWQVMLSGSGYAVASASLGGLGSAPVPGDFDGDRKTDLGVYEAASGNWQLMLSASGYSTAALVGFGDAEYLPVQRDYDGDLKYDPAIYHITSGVWRIMLSGSGYGIATAVGFGGSGSAPVVGDYDGDGKADPAIYHEATGLWTVMLSGSGYLIAYGTLGGSGYAALPADYDGDGKTDPAVYNAANGDWFVMLSASGYGIAIVNFGGPGYDPVGLRPE